MLEAEMIEPGRIIFREVPRPRAGEGEVVIGVKRIGICGSDIHVWHGKHPYTSYPVIQGHELSGQIAEVGPGVEGLDLRGCARVANAVATLSVEKIGAITALPTRKEVSKFIRKRGIKVDIKGA